MYLPVHVILQSFSLNIQRYFRLPGKWDNPIDGFSFSVFSSLIPPIP